MDHYKDELVHIAAYDADTLTMIVNDLIQRYKTSNTEVLIGQPRPQEKGYVQLTLIFRTKTNLV
jgi:hypothetical protein